MGFIKGVIIFAAGAYTGIYACQNYDVPRIDDPQKLWTKVQEYLKQYEKPDKPKWTNALKKTTKNRTIRTFIWT